MQYTVRAIVSKEYLVIYQLSADSPEEAVELVVDGECQDAAISTTLLDDGEHVVAIDRVHDEYGVRIAKCETTDQKVQCSSHLQSCDEDGYCNFCGYQ